jgi:lipopolysaccharide export system permease protein
LSTFDRHLLREWLGILAIVLAAMLGLLVVNICYTDLRSMLEAGAHLGEVLRYLGVTVPSYCAIVLPLGLLVSLLYTLTKLHRANEIIVMRAAGSGIFRLTLPIWIVGAGCCGLVWWLNSTVVPWSVVRSRNIEDAMQYRREARTLPADWVGAVTDVAFDEPRSARMWFMNRYSRATHKGYGVSVMEMDAQGRPTTQLLAAEAWPDRARGGWEFRNGRLVSFSPDTGEAVQNAPFQERFVRGYLEDPQLMLLTDQRPEDLSFFELGRLIRYFRTENPTKAVPYAVRYDGLVADTLGPLVVIAIAIPFAISGVRTNPVVGVSKSIGLFLLYFIITTAASTLASRGWIEPRTAAWLPNGAMAGLAAWFFLRMW